MKIKPNAFCPYGKTPNGAYITYDNKRKKNNLAVILTLIELENFVDSCVTPSFNLTLTIHVFLATF